MRAFANILLFSCTLPLTCFGQFVVAENTALGTSPGTKITISTAGSLNNATPYLFETADLKLSLVGNNQSIEGGITVDHLVVNLGSKENELSIFGNVKVTEALELISGVVVVPSDATATFTYTGQSPISLSTPGNSFVKGMFYQQGGGNRMYPLGTDAGIYAPVLFDNLALTEPVGIQALDGLHSMHVEDPAIKKILDGYWEIVTASGNPVNSVVRLPLPLPELLDKTEKAIVVQEVDGRAVSLGNKDSETHVLSSGNVTSSIIAIGIAEDDITIHELITPHGSFDKNDELEISNLDAYDYNKVMLLDRYGVLLKEWSNYVKGIDKDYFKKLSPGNYIVIVEYGASDQAPKRKSQMITVLRTR